MAVSMADITKLRKMTGAGMMDCKILIQGEFRQRIIDLLKAEGYTQTK